jgi:hypothetical protein
LAARALSPAARLGRAPQSDGGIKQGEWCNRSPSPFNSGGSNTSQPHRASSPAAVIFAGGPVSSHHSPHRPGAPPVTLHCLPPLTVSPRESFCTAQPASTLHCDCLPATACMAPALFPASGPSVRVSSPRCPGAADPSRPSKPRPLRLRRMEPFRAVPNQTRPFPPRVAIRGATSGSNCKHEQLQSCFRAR